MPGIYNYNLIQTMFVGFTTCSYSVVTIHGTCQCNVISHDTGFAFLLLLLLLCEREKNIFGI